MQRTIYVKDADWESIRSAAESDGRSYSSYLLNLHKKNLPPRALGIAEVPDSDFGKEIPMKPINIPEDFVDPVEKAAEDLKKVIKPQSDDSWRKQIKPIQKAKGKKVKK